MGGHGIVLWSKLEFLWRTEALQATKESVTLEDMDGRERIQEEAIFRLEINATILFATKKTLLNTRPEEAFTTSLWRNTPFISGGWACSKRAFKHDLLLHSTPV